MAFLMGRVLRHVDRVTVVSRAMTQGALRLGVRAEKLSVLPMGVDLVNRFSPDVQVVRNRHELLFVGRLVEKKGLGILLAALPGLIARHPSIRLTIAGDGPLRQTLEKQATTLGVNEHLSFLGMTQPQQLRELYCRAVLFVAPFLVASGGDQEGLGLVLVEAMGCGCPVVASDLPAIADVIEHDKTGMLVPQGEPMALADQIDALLGDEQKRDALASAARGYALAHFDWAQIATRYGDLLATLASTETHQRDNSSS
jgi:glycosyltransferase involved in cell wall biosynthesis